MPEHIVVPGGNLANSSALGKGFQEMHHLGLIPRVPKISVIQAEGANPLYRWFTDSNRDDDVPSRPTPAPPPSASATLPAGARPPAVIESMGGWCEQVSEQEIALAKAQIGAEGIGCEPASAVTYAGLKKLAAAGQGTTRRARRPHPHRPHPQGLRSTPSTTTAATSSPPPSKPKPLLPSSAQHAALRKPPVVLEADPDLVLHTLEAHMKIALPV